jgi:predicted translin family RNA/ssDNA-binding protein
MKKNSDSTNLTEVRRAFTYQFESAVSKINEVRKEHFLRSHETIQNSNHTIMEAFDLRFKSLEELQQNQKTLDNSLTKLKETLRNYESITDSLAVFDDLDRFNKRNDQEFRKEVWFSVT